ncbi:MAG: type II secretion system protein E [marine bacterium B5-7]|nr:MAG: type II secretion system protein E [marine bacterium B5-7]
MQVREQNIPTTATTVELPPTDQKSSDSTFGASSTLLENLLADPLIEYLVSASKISQDDVMRCLRMSSPDNSTTETKADNIFSLLTDLGHLSEDDLADGYADVLDINRVTREDYPDLPVEDSRLSVRFMKDQSVIPTLSEETLVVAMANPRNHYARQAMTLATGKPVCAHVGTASDIQSALNRVYGETRSDIDQLTDDYGSATLADEEDVERLRDMASEAPVIRVVNWLLKRAVRERASDVHIEPFEDALVVRFRIDGLLRWVEAPPVSSVSAIISRVKIMARLDIAERRLPQDGRIKLRIEGRDLDLRVSTVPTMYGESVVMRLLERDSTTLDFDALGYNGTTRARFEEVLGLPRGIVLVTGPTGSGKTTTIYTVLNGLNDEVRKIITVEDPIEYHFTGINQIQVKPSIGLDFSNALRAIVRQDPDVIMIGEMRDLETARIAIQSALTGHLVLSTLHTNNAASAITRLLDMGVRNYLLTSTLNAIVAQRLVRRLCDHCKTPVTSGLATLSNQTSSHPDSSASYVAVGCDRCGGRGYSGRVAIAECLTMSDNIRRLVIADADASTIHEAARSEGMITMYEDGIDKLAHGFTTLEEIQRVTSADST